MSDPIDIDEARRIARSRALFEYEALALCDEVERLRGRNELRSKGLERLRRLDLPGEEAPGVDLLTMAADEIGRLRAESIEWCEANQGLGAEVVRLRAVLTHDGRCPAYHLPLGGVPSFPVRCDRLPGHAGAHNCGVHRWPDLTPKDGDQ